ncbi:flagellar hook-associated protein 2 [Acetoanaerobium noterae]|uniref:Flagellar hook-associated protein 2 n=1 Tax=Acetoanaerobium noterae TaxID=745369 RepID=A0A1T5D6Y0_9FIRM|nr:flagellar filament capping protein FliD [Acetoanaerobium noterae]SKB67260.1 flagellar hook-associated protein 2 [Acetoanaerobium noterae]
MVSAIRFGGLASGMDTENIVKQLMQSERLKVDKYTQQKIWKQWQQTEYNSMNKLMANFILDSRKKLELTKTTSSGALVSGGIDSVTWAKSAVSSNSSAFDVTASANAPAGVSTLEVVQLATGASVSSQTSLDTDKTTAGQLLGFSGTTKTVRINEKDIVLLETDTLSDIAQKIRTETGLNANYDATANRFFISSKATGSTDAKITFDNADAENLRDALKFTNLSNTIGKDAIIKYNGTDELTYSSNNISINGLNITLKTTSGLETIRTDTNVDGAYNKIKEFVDEYNKLIDIFNTKLGEKTYRDFPPLTDEQKKDMSETDIKLWEEKAKSGLIRNDSTINNMLSKMRAEIYEDVNGAGAIHELGITTGNWRDNGKLQIDEFKLKEALRNDSEKVLNTLFKTSTLPESTTDPQAIKDRMKDTGAFVRIYDNMISGIKDIVSKSGPGSESTLLRSVKSNILIDYVTKGSKSLLDSDIGEIDKRIDRENQRMITIEQRYWKQFTAMEQAMSQMNSQSSWLSQQFGG